MPWLMYIESFQKKIVDYRVFSSGRNNRPNEVDFFIKFDLYLTGDIKRTWQRNFQDAISQMHGKDGI